MGMYIVFDIKRSSMGKKFDSIKEDIARMGQYVIDCFKNDPLAVVDVRPWTQHPPKKNTKKTIEIKAAIDCVKAPEVGEMIAQAFEAEPIGQLLIKYRLRQQ